MDLFVRKHLTQRHQNHVDERDEVVDIAEQLLSDIRRNPWQRMGVSRWLRTERAVCDRVKGEVVAEPSAARETGCGHESRTDGVVVDVVVAVATVVVVTANAITSRPICLSLVPSPRLSTPPQSNENSSNKN